MKTWRRLRAPVVRVSLRESFSPWDYFPAVRLIEDTFAKTRSSRSGDRNGFRIYLIRGCIGFKLFKSRAGETRLGSFRFHNRAAAGRRGSRASLARTTISLSLSLSEREVQYPLATGVASEERRSRDSPFDNVTDNLWRFGPRETAGR